jgi:TPR repeat protein
MNAARGGDAYALFSIGYMYLRGVHVQQDLDIARHYFKQAAERGLAEGHNGLGVLYFNGQGVPQNITIAMDHFQAAAKLQNADSMYNLGTIYLEGEGRGGQGSRLLRLEKPVRRCCGRIFA